MHAVINGCGFRCRLYQHDRPHAVSVVRIPLAGIRDLAVVAGIDGPSPFPSLVWVNLESHNAHLECLLWKGTFAPSYLNTRTTAPCGVLKSPHATQRTHEQE